jgi:hypothetical protein
MMPFSFWQSGVFAAGTMPTVRLEAPKDSVIQPSEQGGAASAGGRIGLDVLASTEAHPAFNVFQPWPNPFGVASSSGAPAASIRLELYESDVVTVRLYSMLGQPIATLFDAIRPTGACTLRIIPPATLSSGSYFVGVTSGSTSRLLRIVYLR